MLKLFKALLDFSKEVLGFINKLRDASQQERQKMSDLFREISLTLSDVSAEIRLGRIPHGKCGELDMYAQELPDRVRGALGKDKAEMLGQMLHDAHMVEGAAAELEKIAEKEPYLNQIEEAAGKFMALSRLVILDD